MAKFDDWGSPNDDWGSEPQKDSDFDFNWDPEGNFQHASQPQKSLRGTISSLPAWIKISSILAATGLVAFVFVQAGGVTQLRSIGLFRESVSPVVACLNSTQVMTEIGGGLVNQASMDRALSHATILRSQQSGDPAVDDAMWSVADAAFLTQVALESVGAELSLGEVLSGKVVQKLDTPEVQAAAIAVEESVEKLSIACDPSTVSSESVDSGDVVAPETESVAPEEQLETPETDENVIDANPVDKAGVAQIQSATLRVDCISGGVMGSGFFVDLTSLTGSTSDSRIILTNHHVIEGCITEGSVIISQGESEAVAEIVSYDEVFDIAVLSSSAFQNAAVLTPSLTYEVGEEVITSGHPEGIKTAVTFGRVTLFDEDEYLIYSDALAGQGSSGGPMLNANGQAIGIVTYIMTEVRGMSIASPIDAVCIEILPCL